MFPRHRFFPHYHEWKIKMHLQYRWKLGLLSPFLCLIYHHHLLRLSKQLHFPSFSLPPPFFPPFFHLLQYALQNSMLPVFLYYKFALRHFFIFFHFSFLISIFPFFFHFSFHISIHIFISLFPSSFALPFFHFHFALFQFHHCFFIFPFPFHLFYFFTFLLLQIWTFKLYAY